MDLGLVSRYRKELYGFCAIWIILFHMAHNAMVDFSFGISVLQPLQAFVSVGSLGVDIFLFLSGISLYYSFQKNQRADLFIIKRLTRILPPLALTYGVFWIARFIGGDYSFAQLLWNFTLISRMVSGLPGGDNGMWFVVFIIGMYLIFPYIYLFIYGVYIEESSEK
mgnify:CR=1 FL=1